MLYFRHKGMYIKKQRNTWVTFLHKEKAQICTELGLHVLVKYYHVSK